MEVNEEIKPKRVRRSKKMLAELAEKKLLEDSLLKHSHHVTIPNNYSENVSTVIINTINSSSSTSISTDKSLILLDDGMNNINTEENSCDDIIDSSVNDEKPIAKKRGRKPKGGKIIQQALPITIKKENKPNVILHLKCSFKDLNDFESTYSSAMSHDNNTQHHQPGGFNSYNLISKSSLK